MSRQNPTVIIALGGNAISPKNESGNIEKQFEHTRESLNAMMHFFRCSKKSLRAGQQRARHGPNTSHCVTS